MVCEQHTNHFTALITGSTWGGGGGERKGDYQLLLSTPTNMLKSKTHSPIHCIYPTKDEEFFFLIHHNCTQFAL
jgi:hypothetical protein